MKMHLKIRISMVAAALLFPAVGLFAQEVEVRFPEGQSTITVSGSLTDLSPTYVFTNVAPGQEAEARIHSKKSRVIFCRSEIDTSHRTRERTSALEGNLYFCIENLDWNSAQATAFTLTVTLLETQPPDAESVPKPAPTIPWLGTYRSRPGTGARLRHTPSSSLRHPNH